MRSVAANLCRVIGDILQPTHLLFVLVIALLVLGPKRLPEVGRSLGRGLRDFRSALNGDERDRDEEALAPPPPAPVATAPPVAAAPPVATASPVEAPQPAVDSQPAVDTQPVTQSQPVSGQSATAEAQAPEPEPAERAG